MSTPLRHRNQLILAKIETTEGSDASPVVGSDAILCNEITWNPLAGDSVDLDRIRPYFGNSPAIRTRDWVEFSLKAEIAGSGAAATPPAWGTLLRGAAMAETILGSAVTGTAQAGTSTSVTLAAGASATTNLYVGAPISITAGTGNGSKGICVAYNGTTKVASIVPIGGTWSAPDATSTYSIGANVTYQPITDGVESLTFYRYLDGLLHKTFAAKLDASWALSANGLPMIDLKGIGTYQALSDSTPSTPTLSAWKDPVPINTANSQVHFAGLKGDGSSGGIQVSGLTVSLGNVVNQRQVIGYQGIVLSDRKTSGQITFDATAVAVKNWPEYIRTVSNNPLVMQHGMSAGASVVIMGPKVSLKSLSEGEDTGVVTYQGDLAFEPVNGNDELRIVSF